MRLPRLVLYARTSADDSQSPENSKQWQVSVGTNQLAAGRPLSGHDRRADCQPASVRRPSCRTHTPVYRL